jgi:hypothetical protein
MIKHGMKEHEEKYFTPQFVITIVLLSFILGLLTMLVILNV